MNKRTNIRVPGIASAVRRANRRQWNAALEAAAKLVGQDGYTWVRRNLDRNTMANKIDIVRGSGKVSGSYEEATEVDPDEMAAAAILSLRR